MRDLAGQPQGTYTFAVTASDSAGNTGPSAGSDYYLSVTGPNAPTITGTPVSPGTGRTPTWSFTSDPGTTTYCSLSDAAAVVQAPAACASPFTYDLTGLSDSTYTMAVYILSVPGGLIADRLLGARMAVLLGGVVIVCGQFCLTVSSITFFYLGLSLIAIGTR